MAKCRWVILLAGFAAFAASPAGADCAVYPYGICAHVTGGEFPDRERSFAMMAVAGLRYVRCDFEMRNIPKRADGKWDFSRCDAVIADAEKHGVTVLPILWGDRTSAWPIERHFDGWRDFVRQIALRYGDRLPVMEIWNEEDISTFWPPAPNVTNYVETLKIAYETIKSVRPSVRVAFGGTAGISTGFIREAYRLGVKDFFDIMNVHPYAHHDMPGIPEGVVDVGLEELKSLMKAFGDGEKPVWTTEFGWPTQQDSPSAFGLFEAALKVAHPEKKSWNVLVAHWETNVTQNLVGRYLSVLPPGSSVVVCDPAETDRRLAAGGVDAVVFPPGESYPAANIPALHKFVAEGGTLLDFDGAPMWYGRGVKNPKSWNDRKRMRIGVDAWFSGKKTAPKMARLAATDIAIRSGVYWVPEGFRVGRFLTDEFLQPGDKMIPLLEGKNPKTGERLVGACVYAFDSDMKGRVAVCGGQFNRHPAFDERQQADRLARELAILFAEGVEAVFPYELQAREEVPFDRESHFGLLHSNFAPKPAFSAYMTFVSCRPVGSRQLPGEWTCEGGLYCPQWTLPDGGTAGMLWRPDGKGEEERLVRFDSRKMVFRNVFGGIVKPQQRDATTWALHVGPSPVYFTGGRIVKKLAVPSSAGGKDAWGADEPTKTRCASVVDVATEDSQLSDAAEIRLEGEYRGHLQDVWWDGGTNLWWAHTHQLLRTDTTGKILAKADVREHNAGLEVRNGKLYVAVCLLQGKTGGKTTSECHPQIDVHDALTLDLLETHILSNLTDRAGSLAIMEDGSFALGCLRPEDIAKNQARLHQLGPDFKLVRTVVLENFEIPLGIETIKYRDGELYLSCYKGGSGLLVVLNAQTFAEKRRQKFQVGEKYRLPLWELVYHDCVCAHWYWGDYNNKLPSLWWKRDLFNVLYGTMGMYVVENRRWSEEKERFARSYRMTSPVARATGYSEMTDHRVLSDDRKVQASRFSDGTVVVVNFGDEPFALPGDETLPARGHRVRLRHERHDKAHDEAGGGRAHVFAFDAR